MILLHEIAALATIGGFIIHVYMGVFMVPDSMTAITTGLRHARLGQDASSPVVPSSDRPAGAEGMTSRTTLESHEPIS